MALTKIKRSRIDSRHKRKFHQREKRKGYDIKEKRKVESEIKRQKFEEEEAEQKQREEFIEKKRKLNEMMHERIERQKAIRDTFKGIFMDGEGKKEIEDRGQDEVDEIEVIGKLEIKDIMTDLAMVQGKKISVGKIVKKLNSGSGNKNDLIKMIIVMSCLEKETVGVEGNQFLKEIKDLQGLYTFYISRCPELMLNLFLDQELRDILKENEKKAKMFINNKNHKRREK